MTKTLLSLLLITSAASAQLTLDTNFGTGGFSYITQPVTGSARIRVFSKPDGKILVSGSRINGADYHEDYVNRLFANGTNDPSYGNNGFYIFTDDIDDVNAPNSYLLADGSMVCFTNDMGSAIIKLTPEGIPDPTFVTNAGDPFFGAHDFSTMDQDEHLYYGISESPVRLRRINTATGNLDTSFGDASHTLTLNDNDVYTDSPGMTAPGGKFLMFSMDYNSDNSQFYVRRFLPNGALDPDFGTNGSFRLYGMPEITLEDFEGRFQTMVLGDDGSLYIPIIISAPISTTVYKLTPNGQLDLTFGTNGQISLPNQGVVNPYIHNNSLYLLGANYTSAELNSGNLMLAKFNLNGTPDTAFSPNGIYVDNSNSHSEAGETLAFTPDGGIVIAGETRETPSRRAFVAKYSGDILSNNENLVPTRISYSNPVTNQLEIQSDTAVVSIAIFDMDGRFLMHSNKFSIEISNLASGHYIAKVKFADGRNETLKIVKK